MPEPFDWLKEQVEAARDRKLGYLEAGKLIAGAVAEAKEEAYAAALRHLEDLGPLLGLEEIRETLLGDEVIAKALRAGQEVNWDLHRDRLKDHPEGRPTNRDVVRKIIETALDTFNPSVEEGGEGGCEKHGVHDCEDCFIEALAPEGGDGVGAGARAYSATEHAASADSVTASSQQGGDARETSSIGKKRRRVSGAGIGDGLGPEKLQAFEGEWSYTFVARDLDHASVQWDKLDRYAQSLGFNGEGGAIHALKAEELIDGSPTQQELEKGQQPVQETARKIDRTDELLTECADAVARSKGDSEWATACNVIAAIERVWDGRSAQAERRRLAQPDCQQDSGEECGASNRAGDLTCHLEKGHSGDHEGSKTTSPAGSFYRASWPHYKSGEGERDG